MVRGSPFPVRLVVGNLTLSAIFTWVNRVGLIRYPTRKLLLPRAFTVSLSVAPLDARCSISRRLFRPEEVVGVLGFGLSGLEKTRYPDELKFSELLAASARACCQDFDGPIPILDDCGIS